MNKQMIFAPTVTGTKTVSLDQFFEYIKSIESAGDEATLYATVAWIYRCLMIRANCISDLPFKVYQGKREMTWQIPMRRLLWLTEAALSMWGCGYLLKEPGTGGEVTGLRWLNPISMRAETTDKGISHFEQTVGGKVTKFPPERIVYFRSWNPADDLGPGISPLRVALEAGGLARNANLWAGSFFEHGAIPAVLLTIEGRIDEAEADRVTNIWDRVFGGARQAFRTAVLGLGMKPTTIGSPVKDVAMPELMQQVRQQIATAFGIPQTLIEDAANFATAKEHHKSLYTQTILPEAALIEEELNDQLFSQLPRALEFRFEPEGLEIMQEEEADRSQAVLRLVQAGMPLESALTILGIDIPEGVDVTPTATPAAVPMPQIRSWRPELKLWERKALRYLKETGTAACPFESEEIPYMVASSVQGALEEAETAEDVKAVFAGTFQSRYHFAEYMEMIQARAREIARTEHRKDALPE